MDGLLRDLRFALRNIGRSPGVAVVIALSLGFGIGANTAIFSLIRAVMTKSLAVTLACVDLYGTMSYGVGRRRSEIAVRMPFGARNQQVLWLVLRQAVMLALLGVAAGVPLSLWAGRQVSTLLYGLPPTDPTTLAMTASILIATASLAGYVPARRAALVDPAVALKQD